VSRPRGSMLKRTARERAEPDLFGEYASPRFRLPGWGLASLLFAAPGTAMPWLLPYLIRHGLSWSILRPLVLVVPVTAVLGTVLGAIAIRREDGGAAALVGLALNVVVLLMVLAVVVILVF